MSDPTTPPDTTTTLVVQVQPAPADPQKIDLYESTFWGFFAVLIVLMGWKKVQAIFDTPYDG